METLEHDPQVPALSQPVAGLLRRTIQAIRLDPHVYREVQADPSATRQAIAVVGLVALAHAAGGAVRGILFGWNPWSGAVFGLLGESMFFLGASLGIFATARVMGGATPPYRAVLRSFGFATAPGMLILMAAAVSPLGVWVAAPVLVLLLGWRMASGYVAVHQTVGAGIKGSGIIVVVGVAAGLASVVGGTRGLGILLAWGGVGS